MVVEWKMSRGKSLILLFVVVGVLIGLSGVVTIVSAQSDDGSDAPVVPASYYGNLTINGDSAPAGTTVEATINGEVRGSISTNEAGQYGGQAGSDKKLTVSGTSGDGGKEIVFYIEADGFERASADETSEWESGSITALNLSAELEQANEDDNENVGGGGGGSGVSQPPIQEEQSEEESQPAGETVTVPESDGSGERQIQVRTTSASGISFSEVGEDGEATTELPSEVTVSESDATVDNSPNTYAAVGIGTGDTDTSQLRGTVTIEIPAETVNQPDLQMYRRSSTETEWKPLKTTVEMRNQSYVVTGETPGFSTFAVGDAVEDETPVDEEAEEDRKTDERPDNGEVSTSGPDENSGEESVDNPNEVGNESSEDQRDESPEEQPGFTIFSGFAAILFIYFLKSK